LPIIQFVNSGQHTHIYRNKRLTTKNTPHHTKTHFPGSWCAIKSHPPPIEENRGKVSLGTQRKSARKLVMPGCEFYKAYHFVSSFSAGCTWQESPRGTPIQVAL